MSLSFHWTDLAGCQERNSYSGSHDADCGYRPAICGAKPLFWRLIVPTPRQSKNVPLDQKPIGLTACYAEYKSPRLNYLNIHTAVRNKSPSAGCVTPEGLEAACCSWYVIRSTCTIIMHNSVVSWNRDIMMVVRAFPWLLGVAEW